MITVCMTTYNGERFIKKQLESILNQTCKPDEVIICDDNSSDKTIHIIKRFIADNKLEDRWKLYINDENKGYPRNAYYSMGLAKGDIVFLSDQDDLWDLEKIEVMSGILAKNDNIQILACKMGLVDEKENSIKTIIRPNFSQETGKCFLISLEKVLYKNEWSGMVLAYRNSWYRKHSSEVHNTNIPHDLAISVMAAAENGMYQLDKVMAWHRRHSANTAREEHRVKKLMLKERKVEEIRTYLSYLDSFILNKIVSDVQQLYIIEKKQVQMQKRLELLEHGNSVKIILNYVKNHKEIRLFTMLCDAGICLIKRKV